MVFLAREPGGALRLRTFAQRPYEVDDAIDVRQRQSGVTRERHDLAARRLGHRQLEVVQHAHWLPMVGNGVVHVGSDSCLPKARAKRFPVLHPDDEEVRNALVAAEIGQRDSQSGKPAVIVAGNRHPCGIPGGEARQLDAQERGLHLVEPRVPATRMLDARLGRPPVLAQRAQALRNLVVRRDDRTCVAERAQILRRIEAEAAGRCERAGALRVPRRTVDVMPSALAALGIDAPAGLDGISFMERARRTIAA